MTWNRDYVQISATDLLGAVRTIHARGWAPGTGGNYSVVVSRDPLRLLMSPSGADKGSLSEDNLLLIDDHGRKLQGTGNPSAETLLHVVIASKTHADCILHTHSVWNTLLSDLFGDTGELTIDGYEMLKGLSGVTSHEHQEHVPILENSQNMQELAEQVERILGTGRRIHGFLLRNHGLYTWGATVAEALRHVEVLEFLFEVLGRKLSLNRRSE